MDRWLTYFKERFPLPTYFLLVGGISLSGIFLHGDQFLLVPWLTSFVGLMAFFALLRLMDEWKDLQKDQVAHPERPLPRGLLSKVEVTNSIYGGEATLLLYSLVVKITTNSTAGFTFLFIGIYLWLMYREFFSGQWLNSRPLLYAISHQGILLFIGFFAVAVINPTAAMSIKTLAFSLVLLGSFFTYEVCRKLDPKAHPVLGTYIQFYGKEKTLAIVIGTSIVSAIGAFLLGCQSVLWPIQGLVMLSYTLILYRENLYKIPETVATLSLVIHVWAATINHTLSAVL